MTIRTRLARLERTGPRPSTALAELLASVASQGLRVHERPVGFALGAPASPKEVAAALDALHRAPSLHALPLETRP